MNTALAKNPLEMQNGNLSAHQFSNAAHTQKQQTSENELLVIVFYGVSCMGKTTFSNLMKKEA